MNNGAADAVHFWLRAASAASFFRLKRFGPLRLRCLPCRVDYRAGDNSSALQRRLCKTPFTQIYVERMQRWPKASRVSQREDLTL